MDGRWPVFRLVTVLLNMDTIPNPDRFFHSWRIRLMDPYATLKAAHAAGAWILGINHNGEYHRILDPEWSCPADRYIAVVPLVNP